MLREPGLSVFRDELERRPRDPFAVDEKRATGALTLIWGRFYDIGVDGTGLWRALRRDGLPAVTGDGPDQLLAAIVADFKSRPVRLP